MSNLYLVTIKNMRCFYVVADDPNSAYKAVRELLNKEDWFFEKDRNYHDVKQIGSTDKYEDSYTLLLIAPSSGVKKNG